MSKVTFSIASFGTPEQCDALVTYINETTIYHAYLAGDVIVIVVKLHEVADFIQKLAQDKELNWIEYTFQFQH